MTNNILTQQRLKELLEYHPETGLFIRKVTVSSKAIKGTIAGSLKNNGYIEIVSNKKHYKAHRLAWLYMTGEWPKATIDHINGNKSDNRWVNLREATLSDNLRNVGVRKDNQSRIKGIYLDKRRSTYVVQLVVEGKQKKIGYYKNIVDAENAYLVAAKIHYGEYFHS